MHNMTPTTAGRHTSGLRIAQPSRTNGTGACRGQAICHGTEPRTPTHRRCAGNASRHVVGVTVTCQRNACRVDAGATHTVFLHGDAMRARVSSFLTVSLLTGCASYHPRPLQPPDLERAYHARSFGDPALQQYVEANVGTTQTAWPPRSVDLKTLTLIGYYYSASLDVARAQLSAAEA